jgi:uncharacterized SAM-binding protein YcdF (DUF218 family)
MIKRFAVCSQRRTALIALCAFLFVPIMLGARSDRYPPIEKVAQRDAIVVLAGAFEQRAPKAFMLLREGVGKELIIDADDVQHVYGKTSADRAIAIAQTHGEFASKIDVCRMTADSTAEEALQLESCLRTIHARSVMLVTSRNHSRRALAIFKHSLPQYEWSLTIADEQQPEGSDMQSATSAGAQMQEWLKMLWWEGVDRWKSPVQMQAALSRTAS